MMMQIMLIMIVITIMISLGHLPACSSLFLLPFKANVPFSIILDNLKRKPIMNRSSKVRLMQGNGIHCFLNSYLCRREKYYNIVHYLSENINA